MLDKGRPLTSLDSQIAATALAHDLVLVTRNVKDYAGTGIAVLNPWEQSPPVFLCGSQRRTIFCGAPKRRAKKRYAVTRDSLGTTFVLSGESYASTETTLWAPDFYAIAQTKKGAIAVYKSCTTDWA